MTNYFETQFTWVNKHTELIPVSVMGKSTESNKQVITRNLQHMCGSLG